MHIHIIGAGWVGLVTAAAFARHHEVTVVDVDAERIALLRQGGVPFFEEGLQELLGEGMATGALRFVLASDAQVQVPDVALCAVGTPQSATGHADLSAVFASAATYESLYPGCIFVVKSTVPPGTCAAVRAAHPLLRAASNPEFLAEGTAVQDALVPSRIVFGADDAEVRAVLAQVYAPWALRGTPMVATDCITSELAKYAANAFLATKISFVNEMSEFAECVGADMRVIATSMGHDPRIGERFLSYGLGYGGSCFPKDTQALLATAAEQHVDLPLVREAEARNMRQRDRFVEKIVRAFDEAGCTGHVALLGMAYKAGTSDVRSSPAVYVRNALVKRNIPVRWFDPMVARVGEDVGEKTCADACAGASVVFVATAWPEIIAFAKTLPEYGVIWGRTA